MRADYEFDGYAMRPGEVVASGKIRMDVEALCVVFGRNDHYLRTDDGRLLAIRFSGQRTATGDAAYADVRSGIARRGTVAAPAPRQ